jgi:branched-chain amino acid transport system ATP-binding protein
MLRRLQMVRAVALAPRLLLVDEPLAGLGPDDAQAVVALIRGLQADGLTVLLSGRVEPAGLVDRVVRLDRGRVVAGRPAAARGVPIPARPRPTTRTGG